MFPKQKRIKLSPAEWKRMREYILNRDGKCLNCGYKENLVPAHVIGKGCGGDDSARNLVSLCAVGPNMTEGCHIRFDRYEFSLSNRVLAMLEQEPLYLDNN